MFKIALRNIMRNKRRSLLSIGLIILSVVVLFLLKGYFVATYEGLEAWTIAEKSHLQIAKNGFWDGDSGDRRILTRQDMDKIEEILKGKEVVVDYTNTLQVSGILGTENKSTIVSGMGVDPSAEQSINLKSGTKLFAGDTNRVIVGQGIKKKLKIETDEWVSIMATTIDGAYNADSLQLTGSFSVGNADADSHYIMMPLVFAQNLMGTDGVDNFKVMLTETELTDSFIEELKREFQAVGLDVDIKSWNDLATYYHEVRGLYEATFFFLSILVFGIIFISILEVMSMSFFERMNEIGTIRAIGTIRSQVFVQLILESLIIGVVGGITGVLIGWGLSPVINNANITYMAPGSGEVVLYIKVALNNGLVPFLMMIAATSLSALYPALKTSRSNVVEMLRHV